MVRFLILAALATFASAPDQATKKSFEEAASDLPTQMAAAKAEGLPFTEADLYEDHLANGENAAPFYATMEAMSKGHLSHLFGSVFGPTPTKPEQLSQLKQALPELSSFLRLAKQATDLPHCQFPGKPADIEFPRLAFLKALAKGLCAMAELSARDGDYPAMADWLVRASRVGDHAYQVPTLIGALVGPAVKSIVARRIEVILAQTQGSLPCIDAVEKAIPEMQGDPPFANCVRSDFLNVVNLLKPGGLTDKEVQVMGTDPELVKLGVTPKLAISAYNSRFLQVLCNVSILTKAGGSIRDKTVQLVAYAQTVEHADATYMLTKAFSWGSLAAHIPVPETALRLVATGSQLLRIRNSTGQFPATFQSSLTDPYSEKPFLYKKTPDGFVLSSAGAAVIPGVNPRWVSRPETFSYPFTYPIQGHPPE
jgi:hypothetical protein